MIWDKLVDRCLLFTDAPGGLLKELLKEAEQELANKLELFDSIYTIEVPSTLYGLGISSQTASTSVDHNYHKLPMDYIRDMGVSHKGRPLSKMNEKDIYRKTNGSPTSATPTAYGISGDFIVFDTNPSEGDKFILHYKSMLDDANTDKVLNIVHYDVQVGSNDMIYVDTLLGSLLNGTNIVWEGTQYAISAGQKTSISLPPGVPDRYFGNKFEENVGINADTYPKLFKGSRYTLPDFTGGTAAASKPEDATGSLCISVNYRALAPLIPDRFHTDLCSYAIAIASAKSSPETYNQYWTKWIMNMDNLINESADRDLIHSIREEI